MNLESVEKELNKVSSEIKENRAYVNIENKIRELMKNGFAPTWPTKSGDITRTESNQEDFYLRVSDDGKSIEYGCTSQNDKAYNNGYDKQFCILHYKIQLDNNGNLVVTSALGGFNSEVNKSEGEAHMYYDGVTYDNDGNEIKREYVDTKCPLSYISNKKDFEREANYMHCPNFTENLEYGKQPQFFAAGDCRLFSIKRSMIHPAAVTYKIGTTNGVRAMYQKTYNAVQLDQYPKRLNPVPRIVFDHPENLSEYYESTNQEYWDKVIECEQSRGIVTEKPIER